MSAHGLRFDTLDLVSSGGSGEPFWFKTEAEGASFGAPQPVEVVLSSQVLDGSLTSKVRDENRELSFIVRIKGADLKAVSEGEKALDLACGKPTTLTWTPPDGFGKPTVYDVLTSSYEAVFDDLGELRNERTVRLRIVALPFGRSTTRVTDDAVAVDVGGGTIVDACESTAGWSSPSTTPPAVDTTIFNSGTGSVRMASHQRVHYLNAAGYDMTTWTNTDTHAMSVATGAGGYLSVLIRMDFPATAGPPENQSKVSGIVMTTSAGIEVVSFATTEVLPNGFVRYSWPVAAGVTITSLRFEVIQRASGTLSVDASVRYDEFRLSSTPVSSKQYVKTIDVHGSARAPGSLHVSASVALGQLLLFTVPDAAVSAGFRPDIRRYLTAGPTTVDANAMNGSHLANAATFEVPVSSLTEGSYMVVARVYTGASSVTLSLTAQMKVGGNLFGPVTTISTTESTPGAARYIMLPVGTISLPVLPMQNPDNTAKVQIKKGPENTPVDEIWLLPLAGNLTIADLGTGTVSPSGASANFWLDSASPTQPNGGWWKGASSDRSNAVSAVPDLIEPGDGHVFTPPRMLVYVASTNAVGPVVTTDYFPHAFGNLSE